MDINEFKKYKDRNFFAYICTSWQVKGVEVAINTLRKKNERIKATVFVADHDITGRIVYKKDCPPIEDVEWVEVRCDEYNKLYKTENKIKRFSISEKSFRLKKDVYVFCPGNIDIRWLYLITTAFNRGITIIFGDDGAGGYIGYGDLYKKSFINSIVHAYFIKKLYKTNRIIDQRILTKNEFGYVRNEIIADEYEQVLSKGGSPLSKDIIDYFSGKVLLNTQCLYDNKQIDGEQDLNALQHLHDVLGDNRNKDVIIKPHPRELSLDRYTRFPEWKVMSEINITQEEIFSKLKIKPKMIIGIHSSTLINLKALFGIETISLVNFFEKENITSGEKKICKDFIKEFDGFVRCPKTDEELKNIVKNIID